MDSRSTEPRDLRPQLESDAPLRRERSASDEVGEATGRTELRSPGHAESGHEDSVTKSSRVFFFVMAAIIALAIAVFLVLHPQAGD